ncbi:nucleotidyltransferase domain-containing protein [Methanocalculus sp.]|uniref:nucleotidyltransferase domain-containing protein n=1 Tax=Methanocalculus sp. TaxID=2004547 RepID=UPI0031842D6D
MRGIPVPSAPLTPPTSSSQTFLAYVWYDLYPVSPGNPPLIPFRHVASFFEATGQSVMHLHVIPRYVGDMEEPKGGVRGVISGKSGKTSSSSRTQVSSGGALTAMSVQVTRRKNDSIIRQLEAVVPHLKERFGVARIGFFGSVVRGEDRPDSDIDLLVEFAPGEATFRNFMELVYYLEDLFGRNIDLVTDQGLSKYIRQTVEKEVVWCEA